MKIKQGPPNMYGQTDSYIDDADSKYYGKQCDSALEETDDIDDLTQCDRCELVIHRETCHGGLCECCDGDMRR